MKLGDILRQRSNPIQPRPVEFWIASRDQDLQQKKALAKAVLVYVNEDQREALRVEALADVKKRFPDKLIPEAVVEDEMLYRRLFLALRDEEPNPDGNFSPFADTVLELRQALTKDEANRLDEEYRLYLDTEFPPSVPDDEWVVMVEDAKKNTLPALLTSYGFERSARLLSFLAGRLSR